MTDPPAPDPSSPIPNPTIVDPSAVNGQCEQIDQEPPRGESQGEFKMDQEMKISENVDGEGTVKIILVNFSTLRQCLRNSLHCWLGKYWTLCRII